MRTRAERATRSEHCADPKPREEATVDRASGDLSAPHRPARGVAGHLGRRYRVVLAVADIIAAVGSAALGALLLVAVDVTRAGDIAVVEILLAAAWTVTALHLHGLYRRPPATLRPSEWWRPYAVLRCLPTAIVGTLGTEVVVSGGDRSTLSAAVAMALLAVVLVPLARHSAFKVFRPPLVTRILVVGTGGTTDRLTSRLARCPDTVTVGQVDDDPVSGAVVLGGLCDLPELCVTHAVDRVVVAFSRTPDHVVLSHLRRLEGRVPISVLPRLFELHSWRSVTEELYGLSLLHVHPASLSQTARLCKRTVDVALATCALIVTAPVLIAAALAIKIDSPGPVFFRQERIGRSSRSFRIVKFRTMSADAWERRRDISDRNEVDGPLFKMHRDPRVTRVGSVLRRTSIDELPQLFNVLLGDMALVGPRPLPTEESRRLDGAALTRFDVAPGITGLWQVSGRSDLTYADLQHLDSVYVRSWSLMWDLRILWETPRSVWNGRGAY